MTNDAATELIRFVDGEPTLSVDALSLLFGITTDEINECTTTFPKHWMQAGRRRCGEASAATGSEDILDLLGYWAKKDWDCTITFQADQ